MPGALALEYVYARFLRLDLSIFLGWAPTVISGTEDRP